MGLCGSARCGCGVTTDGTIDITGSGESGDPYLLGVGNPVWFSFTPTWNNLTVGNASVNAGAYSYAGDELRVKVSFALGSTSTVDGFVSYDLPNGETAASFSAALWSIGGLNCKNGSTDETGHVSIAENGTEVGFYCGGNNVNTGTPFTWAVGDQMQSDIVVIL